MIASMPLEAARWSCLCAVVQGGCGASITHDGGGAVRFRASRGGAGTSSLVAESCVFQHNRSAPN